MTDSGGNLFFNCDEYVKIIIYANICSTKGSIADE